MISRSWRTRSSLSCMAGVVSPISSRKIVPFSASSNSPGWSFVAPVNAPALWPNSVLSRRVSGSAPQLTATKRGVAAGRLAVDVASDDFLAHSGLARDQHRRIELGHALGQFDHPLKLATANLHGGNLATGLCVPVAFAGGPVPIPSRATDWSALESCPGCRRHGSRASPWRSPAPKSQCPCPSPGIAYRPWRSTLAPRSTRSSPGNRKHTRWHTP